MTGQGPPSHCGYDAGSENLARAGRRRRRGTPRTICWPRGCISQSAHLCFSRPKRALCWPPCRCLSDAWKPHSMEQRRWGRGSRGGSSAIALLLPFKLLSCPERGVRSSCLRRRYKSAKCSRHDPRARQASRDHIARLRCRQARAGSNSHQQEKAKVTSAARYAHAQRATVVILRAGGVGPHAHDLNGDALHTVAEGILLAGAARDAGRR